MGRPLSLSLSRDKLQWSLNFLCFLKWSEGISMISPFSPAGRSAERMRGDEGVFPRVLTVTPPHPPFGHLLPAGEKRGDAENPLTSIFLAFGNIASVIFSCYGIVIFLMRCFINSVFSQQACFYGWNSPQDDFQCLDSDIYVRWPLGLDQKY